MNIYKVLSVLVVLGVLSFGGGILLGVSASANYLVELRRSVRRRGYILRGPCPERFMA